jgi:hypothetical protein
MLTRLRFILLLLTERIITKIFTPLSPFELDENTVSILEVFC